MGGIYRDKLVILANLCTVLTPNVTNQVKDQRVCLSVKPSQKAITDNNRSKRPGALAWICPHRNTLFPFS